MQSPIDNLQSSIDNAPLPPSTGIDTIQQNPTKSNGNSCVPARVHEAQHGVLAYRMRTQPAHAGTAPSHVISRTLPRHIPHPPTSYPAPSHVISRTLPRHSRTLPRHSRTLPRHSREGGNPSPRHELPPSPSRFNVPLGVAVPEPSCQ